MHAGQTPHILIVFKLRQADCALLCVVLHVISAPLHLFVLVGKSAALNSVLSGTTIYLCKAPLLNDTHIVLQAGSHVTCQEWERHQLRWEHRWKHNFLWAWAASRHGGRNADVQMVHSSRRVIVVQVVVHMLMGAVQGHAGRRALHHNFSLHIRNHGARCRHNTA